VNINEQGLLIAPGILQKTSPNHGGPLTEPKFIVAHWTGGTTLEGAASWLSNPAARASAHIIIGRDGKLAQLVPANVVAWHAGTSRWEVKTTKKKSTVYVGLNKYSFGIEFVNLGRLKKTEAGKFVSSTGRIVDPAEVIQSDVDGKYYQAYTEAQISTGDSVMVALKSYAPSIEDVIGHHDIAPERKLDPGPEFPFAHYRALLLGRA
jgi:N-acetylmuramoyl-L-alanine amidase